MTTEERIKKFEEYFRKKKRQGVQLYWFKYNPHAEFNYDLEDAMEDVEWMLAELKRLTSENEHYREFIDTLRGQMEKELNT